MIATYRVLQVIRTRSYSKFLKQSVSTIQNNITYHMGLDASGSHATQTALILSDSVRLNYENLSKYVGSMVALLHTTYGISRGDRVLSRVEKSVDSLVLYLATIRLGAIYVPLSPVHTMAETIYFVEVSSVFCYWLVINKFLVYRIVIPIYLLAVILNKTRFLRIKLNIS
ncbi:unnamed protein product [Onchocerca flexuosa]|uniref:AMP-binding domain-containing protein n=1 Tax=Onchocerca flexuosa TaxID=387005 RepID=A0A183HQM6_9BILA|nr:unnamed protein product [Onchocerca flexuosa]